MKCTTPLGCRKKFRQPFCCDKEQTFALKFEAAERVGYSLATIVAAVYSRVLATPDLIDGLIIVNLDAVKEHRHHGLF